MTTIPSDHNVNATKLSVVPYLFLLLFATSLSANIYLGRSVSRLKQLAYESNRATIKTENKVGGTVNVLSVQTSSGDTRLLQLAGAQDTVVYIFSPKCHWCALNLASIRSLAEQRNSSYRFIGISSYPDKELLNKYLAENPLPFPAFIDDSPNDLTSLDFTGTPQTLLIRKDGTVEHNWSGAYGRDVRDSVQKFFSIKLPDVTGFYTSKGPNNPQMTKAGAS
jgi:peroxiredoxin